MKKWKVWLAMTAVLCTTSMIPPKAEACSCVSIFNDDRDMASYATTGVLYLNGKGILQGDSEHNFHPSASITREEMAVVLAKTLQIAPVDAPSTTPTFSDVPANGWSFGYVQGVAHAGLMVGDEKGNFNPQQPITREELAATLIRAMKLDVTGRGKNLNVADQASVSTWARDAVQAALETGLMHGDTPTTFNPQATAERQQVAVVIFNYLMRQGVQEKLNLRMQAIHEKNLDKFLTTLDPDQARGAYKVEQTHWFQDLIGSSIADYKVEVLDIKVNPPMTLDVTLHQTYTMDGKPYELTYHEHYNYYGEGMYDAGELLDELRSSHFVVQYAPEDKATAEKVRDDAEAAYADLQAIYPHQEPAGKQLGIKLYHDPEFLRQSVKLSFAWQFIGWYEYGESIKLSSQRGPTEYYQRTIEHEMVHELTVGQSNNNLPYWFAEGLATYYTDLMQDGGPLLTKPYMSIADLEKINLETLTDNQEVSIYYNTSGHIVKFLARQYGEDKVRELVQRLGSYPYQEGTASVNDTESLKRLHETLPKIFGGKTLEQLDTEWQAWIKNLQENH
ncbi:S-layer homology domain-containing protein [Tumebacillus sp. ITR2]|uniref:S-layer homology domain-containing protein n=1 Tax=Tumebacillus amylolyticus TaxID=2801339 RepID=A0ABS1JEE5_9BACL|nr:S-layer homology domain-containing protein [Tumebacillus amylolyticus]MBL0388580.1 S-layer homology domain-containing protein [Tumebacillus amylolyticus]